MQPTVLIADGDPFDLKLLQELCESAGYRVAVAAGGEEVLAVVARDRPDLLVLDVADAALDGMGALRVLKEDEELRELPVLVVTAPEDADVRRKALELGADDYLTRPYRLVEVQQRIRLALRLRRAEQTARAAEATLRESSIDQLTHAGNAQQLVISLEYELTRAERYGHALTCVVVRVDNTAAIAERGGPGAQDGVLVQIAAGLRTCIRAIDHLFREGDEFVILLPETDPEGAETVLGRIRERAADESLWSVAVEPLPAVSLAASSWPEDAPESGTALRDAARERLAPA